MFTRLPQHELVPLGEGGEASRHRSEVFIGLRIGLVEDQEGSAGSQGLGDGRERPRLQLRGDLVDDQETRHHVVRPVGGEMVGTDEPRFAPPGEPPLGDEPLRQLDRARLDVHADARGLREPLGDLDDRPSTAAPDIEHPRPGFEPRGQRRQPGEHEVEEDPRQSPQGGRHLLDEGPVVRLIGLRRAPPEVTHVVTVVLANQHVDACHPAKVEGRLGPAQDLVEVRGHAPPLALSLEQPEREGGPAECVRVEGLSAQPIGERGRGQSGRRGERLPDAELPSDLQQVCRVVAADELVQACDLLSEGWCRTRRAPGVHEAPFCVVAAAKSGLCRCRRASSSYGFAPRDVEAACVG